MTMERFKNILLPILIVISLAQTWLLLNYQAEFEKKEPDKLFQKASEEKSKDISSVITPTKVYYKANERHYVSTRGSTLYLPFSMLKDVEITDITQINDSVKEDKLVDFMYKDKNLVWEYPDEVPLSIFSKILKYDKRNMDNYMFDRVVLPTSSSKIKEMYFISTENESILRAKIRDVNKSEVTAYVNQMKKNDESVFMYRINEKNAVFLPTKPFYSSSISYLLTPLKVEDYRKSLFPNPDYVKQDHLKNDTVYTDGTRLLIAKKNYQSLLFEKPNTNVEEFLRGGQLLTDTVNFISSHGGFTDSYIFQALDNRNGQVNFRMYKNNIPIYGGNDDVTIEVRMSTSDVLKYKRPLFELQYPLKNEEKVRLSSGYDVISSLEYVDKFKKQKLQDIFVGYSMEGSIANENRIVKLTPEWFIKYDKKVYRLNDFLSNEKEGLKSGLE